MYQRLTNSSQPTLYSSSICVSFVGLQNGMSTCIFPFWKAECLSILANLIRFAISPSSSPTFRHCYNFCIIFTYIPAMSPLLFSLKDSIVMALIGVCRNLSRNFLPDLSYKGLPPDLLCRADAHGSGIAIRAYDAACLAIHPVWNLA